MTTNTATNTATATVYTAEKLAKLEKAVARINRKLDKAQLANVGLAVEEAVEAATRRKVWQATVTYPTLEEMGWQVQAVVKSAPEFGSYHHVLRGQPDEIPQKYWDAPMMCEHCGAERKRRTTVTVRHQEDGRWMQVGSTCVSDFLGGGASKIVKGLEALDRVRKELDDAALVDETGPFAIYFEPELVLATTIQHLMDNGGVFEPTNGRGAVPGTTAHAVGTLLMLAHQEGRGFGHLYTETAATAADKCVAWLAGHLTTEMRAADSYLRNLETAAYNPTSPSPCANDSGFALLCSLPNYWREQVRGRQAQPAAQAQPQARRQRIDTSNSKHLGTVGSWLHAGAARVLYTSALAQTRTGKERTLVIFATHSGDVITWTAWGGAARGLRAGHDVADLEGSVLSHGERNGERRTMLKSVTWGRLLAA